MYINKQTNKDSFLSSVASQINKMVKDNDKSLVYYLNMCSRVLSKHERAVVVRLIKH